MTTKVKIEVVQAHMPIHVEVLRSDGTMSQFSILRGLGNSTEEYVHSGQTLRVRERTTEEMTSDDDGINEAVRRFRNMTPQEQREWLSKHDDPPSCPHGVMAGNCEVCNPPIDAAKGKV